MSLLSEKMHLRSILQSKRANIYYLEYCRVLVHGGRVEYLTQDQDKQAYWNIPIANTTVLLLGTGTSVTQAAVRMLSAAGVMLGFCGGGGSPLLAGTEIEWLSPQSEYRPTEYVQQWLSFWVDSRSRLEVAQKIQELRVKNIRNFWENEGLYQEYGLYADDSDMQTILERVERDLKNAKDTQELLQIEARATKGIYKYVATTLDLGDFIREHSGGDKTNDFLNHGNYLAYGLAATGLWVLGIPHGFPVMHGKTRRGALVFDIADLAKDALVLPTAFISALRGDREQEFRDTVIDLFVRHNVLDLMINTIKSICAEYGRG